MSLGQIPSGWTVTKLGTIHRDDSRIVDPRKQPDALFELWSIPSHATGAPELVTGTIIGSSKQTVERGTVLLSGINPRLNRVWVVEPRSSNQVIASTEWIPYFPQPGLSPKYLAYFLQQHTVRDFLASRASGVGGSLTRVKASVADEIDLPVAPEREQERIVDQLDALLTDLESSVAALKRVQANLKRYRASVLKAACEGRLVPTEAEMARKEGRPYETGEQLLQRTLVERRAKWEADQLAKMIATGKPPKNDDWKKKYKEPEPPDTSNLPELPEGWTWASLDQLFGVERGRFSIRPRNDPRYYNGSYPFVQIGDLPRDGGSITRYTQTLNDKGLQVSRLFRKGTVLVAIVGATIGNTGVLSFDSCCPDSLVALRSGHDALLRFAEIYLQSKKLQIRSTSYASGGQPNINLAFLCPYAIPVAPQPEMERIVAELGCRFSVMDEVGNQCLRALARASRLRQSILMHAFEGKLVPQDPNDDAASVLLERIRDERAEKKTNKTGGPSMTRRAMAEAAR